MKHNWFNEPTDYPQGYYHVYVGYAPDHAPVVIDLASLADILPHGYGIDSDWRIRVQRNGDVTVIGEYHQMDESGGYNGWKTFRFTIRKCRKNVYQALIGPCTGKFQITKVVGRTYLESFRGGGDNADYLYDVVSCALSEEMDIHAIDSMVVDSEESARTYR